MDPKLILIIFVITKLIELIIQIILIKLNTSFVKSKNVIPERYTDKITKEEYEKSRSYTYIKHKFGIITDIFDLSLLFLFIYFGGFKIVENFSINLTQSEEIRGIIFCFAIAFGKEIIDIPFSLYSTFVIEQKFGFNKMTLPLFFKDMIKKLILSFLFGAPLIYFLIWIINASGNLWWIYGFIGISLFQLFIIWIYPTLIAPLFNKFKEIEEGELKEGVLNIAKKVEFKLSKIYVMDGSKRSSHSNAYFTGFGKNRRIVLFDTLINSLSKDELISVLAHEMAHNKLKHIQKMLFISLFTSFIGFYIWSILLTYSPLYQAFGLEGNNLFPALVIFPLVMGPISFLISPLFSILSRKHEYQADSFAANATNTGDHLKEALLKLNKENLSNLTPHPWYSFFYYSHPTLDERLDSLEEIEKNLNK